MPESQETSQQTTQKTVEINFRPLHKKVLIQRCMSAIEDRGILIPERYRHPSIECEVIAIGREVTKVKVDDRVCIGRWEGQPVKIEGIPLLVIEEDAILFVCEDDDPPEEGRVQ